MMEMGTGKKNPGKFTLKFNMMDPAHREVAELLDSMGRMKAQFIANAVRYYRFYSENSDTPTAAPVPVDYATLEAIVRRILTEKIRGHRQSQPTRPQNNSLKNAGCASLRTSIRMRPRNCWGRKIWRRYPEQSPLSEKNESGRIWSFITHMFRTKCATSM